MKTVQARVCIVGSGVAGGIVAMELLNAGVRDVLMLEVGAKVPMRNRRMWLDYVTGAQKSPFSRYSYGNADGTPRPLDFRNAGRDEFDSMMLRIRGGSTVIWAGRCLRMKPEDFRLFSNTKQGVDWPLSYDDLEPFYALAEHTLQVSGDAKDPGHPRRSGPFPLPPAATQAVEESFVRAMDALDYSTQHTPISRNTRPAGGMPQCVRTGTCEYCPIGARFTGDQLIDRLEERPGFKVLLRTAAKTLVASQKQRVEKLVAVDQETGEEIHVEADVFVVCGGGIETPKLLLSSVGPSWPKGVANDTGIVGKYLTNHVDVSITGRMARDRTESPRQALYWPTVTSRHFDTEEYQRAGKFIIHGTAESDWETLADQVQQGKRLNEVRRALGDVPWNLGLLLEQRSVESNRVELGRMTDSLGLPSTVIHFEQGETTHEAVRQSRKACEPIMKKMGFESTQWSGPQSSVHPMGTCRMSDSAGAGVVDRDLRAHGVENLFLCGSAVFPSPGAANPTLTIAALSHRLGKHVAKASLR